MRQITLLIIVAVLTPLTAASQTQAPSLPLGAGRPEVPGITRTQLRDDAKATVTRVRFEPNAAEPPHTHPYDVLLVPVLSGTLDLMIADRKVTAVAAGDVQFIPKGVTHHLKNVGRMPFELIAVALK